MSIGSMRYLQSNRSRKLFGCLLFISSVMVVRPAACAPESPSALPTFPPIAAPVMLGGSGLQFSEQNYQLIAPSLRKCANDWQSTKYVDYLPEIPGKVTIVHSSFDVMAFLKVLSEKTGRRFALQRGVERVLPVSAQSEDWLPVLERFVDAAGLDLENVQDILVISDPKATVPRRGSTYRDLLIALGIVSAIGGGLAWHFLWPKKRIDPRGGWSK